MLRVSTLPIRNGNISAFLSIDMMTSGKYLTYKEWKRKRPSSVRPLPDNVSTLPIRNGNTPTCWVNFFFHSCKYLTYKEWKLCYSPVRIVFFNTVSTLPIRNGNGFSVATQQACLLMLLPLL